MTLRLLAIPEFDDPSSIHFDHHHRDSPVFLSRVLHYGIDHALGILESQRSLH